MQSTAFFHMPIENQFNAFNLSSSGVNTLFQSLWSSTILKYFAAAVNCNKLESYNISYSAFLHEGFNGMINDLGWQTISILTPENGYLDKRMDWVKNGKAPGYFCIKNDLDYGVLHCGLPLSSLLLFFLNLVKIVVVDIALVEITNPHSKKI